MELCFPSQLPGLDKVKLCLGQHVMTELTEECGLGMPYQRIDSFAAFPGAAHSAQQLVRRVLPMVWRISTLVLLIQHSSWFVACFQWLFTV